MKIFLVLLLTAPIMANAMEAKSASQKVKTKTNTTQTEMGYKSSERVALKQAVFENRFTDQ